MALLPSYWILLSRRGWRWTAGGGGAAVRTHRSQYNVENFLKLFYSTSNHKSFKRGKSVNNILAILEKNPEILELLRLWQQLLPDLELALSHFLIVSRGLRLILITSTLPGNHRSSRWRWYSAETSHMQKAETGSWDHQAQHCPSLGSV